MSRPSWQARLQGVWRGGAQKGSSAQFGQLSLMSSSPAGGLSSSLTASSLLRPPRSF